MATINLKEDYDMIVSIIKKLSSINYFLIRPVTIVSAFNLFRINILFFIGLYIYYCVTTSLKIDDIILVIGYSIIYTFIFVTIYDGFIWARNTYFGLFVISILIIYSRYNLELCLNTHPIYVTMYIIHIIIHCISIYYLLKKISTFWFKSMEELDVTYAQIRTANRTLLQGIKVLNLSKKYWDIVNRCCYIQSKTNISEHTLEKEIANIYNTNSEQMKTEKFNYIFNMFLLENNISEDDLINFTVNNLKNISDD